MYIMSEDLSTRIDSGHKTIDIQISHDGMTTIMIGDCLTEGIFIFSKLTQWKATR